MALIGLDTVLRQLEDFAAGASEGATAGIEDEAERIKVRSQELCPVGEGPRAGLLRDSAKVVRTEDGAQVIYDAVDATGEAFSVRVHEDLSAVHETGGPKFLERASNEAQAGMSDRIGQRVVERAKRNAGL